MPDGEAQTVTQEPLLDPALVRQRMQTVGLADTAYQMIREAMLAGRIKPGTWLRQRDLAAELGVSQVTVREALNRLIAAGLATRERFRGVRTTAAADSGASDLVTLRAMLEGWAAEQAAAHIGAAELARLRSLLPHSTDHVRRTLSSVYDADREFHWGIIRASQSQHIIHLLQYVWDALPSGASPGLHLDEAAAIARANARAHRQILDAFETADGPRARRLIAEHVHYGARTLPESVRQAEASDLAREPHLTLVELRSAVRTHDAATNGQRACLRRRHPVLEK